MLKKDVEIGGYYAIAHDSYNRLAVIRLESESIYGGYNAVKLKTGRRIRVKSAAKLRFPVVRKDGRWTMAVTEQVAL